jgi:hypothetical protein
MYFLVKVPKNNILIRESLKKLQIGHKMGFNYLSRTKKNLCLPPFKDSQNFLKKKK